MNCTGKTPLYQPSSLRFSLPTSAERAGKQYRLTLTLTEDLGTAGNARG